MEGFALEVVDGPGRGATYELRDRVEIGRDVGPTEVSLDDPEVSRRHAEVTVRGDEVAIRDLGSTNGTHVNERPIEGPRRLTPGDQLRLGLTVLALRTPTDSTGPARAIAPSLTAVSAEVLEPVADGDLAGPVGASANSRALLAEETDPAYVPAGVAAPGPDRPEEELQLQHLVDTRVKRRTTIAAFALVAIAALAVVVVLGAG